MENLTTREHYEKFRDFAEKLRMKVNEASLPMFGVKDKNHLLSLYNSDKNLNNIPLARFDAHHSWIAGVACGAGIPWSMSYTTCLYKYCLIYQVLGATPKFEK